MTAPDTPTGTLVWFTGLPQSGKTTLARRTRERLERPSCLLDSDEIRDALVPRLSYDSRDRDHFYESLANLAALLYGQGLVVLVAATANRAAYRARARGLVERFIEVYVDASVETCSQRDKKGLYAQPNLALPGRGAIFEPPAAPAITASGGLDDRALERLLELL